MLLISDVIFYGFCIFDYTQSFSFTKIAELFYNALVQDYISKPLVCNENISYHIPFLLYMVMFCLVLFLKKRSCKFYYRQCNQYFPLWSVPFIGFKKSLTTGGGESTFPQYLVSMICLLFLATMTRSLKFVGDSYSIFQESLGYFLPFVLSYKFQNQVIEF